MPSQIQGLRGQISGLRGQILGLRGQISGLRGPGGDERTNERTDGQTNESPLCSTGLRPLWGRCPKGGYEASEIIWPCWWSLFGRVSGRCLAVEPIFAPQDLVGVHQEYAFNKFIGRSVGPSVKIRAIYRAIYRERQISAFFSESPYSS